MMDSTSQEPSVIPGASSGRRAKVSVFSYITNQALHTSLWFKHYMHGKNKHVIAYMCTCVN